VGGHEGEKMRKSKTWRDRDRDRGKQNRKPQKMSERQMGKGEKCGWKAQIVGILEAAPMESCRSMWECEKSPPRNLT
jgi:hypothetical protein